MHVRHFLLIPLLFLAHPIVAAAQWCPAFGPDDHTAELARGASISRAADEGTPLELRGTVRRADGRTAAPGVIVYVYHTGTDGRYTPSPNATGLERLHGRLRGWTRTDSAGRYHVQTIRPGAYPGGREAQHIHLEVLPNSPHAVACEIDPVQFTDDPLLTAAARAAQPGYGGRGVVTPTPTSDGRWRAVRDITLWPATHVDTMRVDTEASVVRWRGTKFNGRGAHEGTIRLAPGAFVLGGPTMVAGTLVLPLETLEITDIPRWEPIPRSRLRTSLLSDKFFAAARFPNATLRLQDAVRISPGVLRVSALLTLRDQTHPITFNATLETPPEASVAATAYFRINRHTWGLDYRGSQAGNDLVDDDITFTIRLVARRR
jgi:hypothetical protein